MDILVDEGQAKVLDWDGVVFLSFWVFDISPWGTYTLLTRCAHKGSLWMQ